MSQTSTVTSKGQTTIPQHIREKYGIDPGDQVMWRDTEAGVVVEKVVRDDGRGALFGDNVSDEEREHALEEMAESIRENREAEWAID